MEPHHSSMSPEEFVAWNEAMIGKYHPTKYHRSSNVIVRAVEARRTARILAFLHPQPEDRILDVGCGAGDILEHVRCGRLFGVDISNSLVQEAQSRLGSTAVVVQGDAEDLDSTFPHQTFDKIYCSEVLEHVQNPQKVVASIARLAHPRTNIVLSVPHERLINAVKSILSSLGLLRLLFGRVVSRKMDDEWHLHVFSRQDCIALCQQAGLRVIRLEGIPFRWLPLRYVLLAQKLVP